MFSKSMQIFQLNYFIIVTHRNQEIDSTIVKSANHFHISNERDVLLRFQTPSLRPLLDEIRTLLLHRRLL